MHLFEHLYIYSLYTRNQKTFHDWLFIKKSKILSHWSTPIVGMVLLCVLIVVGFLTYHGMSEIDAYDYNRITRNAHTYAKEVPDYSARAKYHMEDGKITEWEFDDLGDMIQVWYKKRKIQDLVDAKQDAAKLK